MHGTFRIENSSNDGIRWSSRMCAPIFIIKGSMMSRRVTGRKNRQNEIVLLDEERSRLSKINIVFKNDLQKEAVDLIKNNTISFLIGPAGGGKTYVAISYAIHEFLKGNFEKIILTRPAMEAGEKLGFLPGEINNKIQPYMIPLMDFLEDKLDPKFVKARFEEGLFEIAPLSYLRGRNLRGIILADEIQNCTVSQLKMLLTRINEGGKIICTGDFDQSDQPLSNTKSLKQIIEKLSRIEGIGMIELTESVRHPIIAKILKAFEEVK